MNFDIHQIAFRCGQQIAKCPCGETPIVDSAEEFEGYEFRVACHGTVVKKRVARSVLLIATATPTLIINGEIDLLAQRLANEWEQSKFTQQVMAIPPAAPSFPTFPAPPIQGLAAQVMGVDPAKGESKTVAVDGPMQPVAGIDREVCECGHKATTHLDGPIKGLAGSVKIGPCTGANPDYTSCACYRFKRKVVEREVSKFKGRGLW